MSDAAAGRVAGTGLEAFARLALRLGRLLLASGSDADHVVARIEAVAARRGIVAQVFAGSERLLLTVEAGGAFRTRIGHALPGGGVDLGRLSALERILDDLAAGAIDLVEAGSRADAVEAAAPTYPAWLVVAAVATTTACLARLFEAAWTVVAAALAAGIVNTLLRRAFAARHLNPIAAAFLTAAASGLTGALLLKLVPGASPALCLAAAGMILVPGVPLINAIDDLAHGHAGIGLARLATGTVTILAIGFGLFFAASLAGDALPVAAGGGRLPVPEDALVSGLAAIGYGLLFGVPPRALPACVICGIAGHGGRTALAVTGLDLAAATLAASALVGLLATGLAERLSLPWTTFAFPGVVAMIPGSYAFRAATGALAVMEQGAAAPPGLVAETLGLAVAAMVMTAAVGSGLLLAVSARRLLGNRRRHARG
ncbi:threonine/serine ThrE exporter family protein [Methylobacterium sp. SyP6R]|uniref:threonine/serine ThrE exporter family protein n=1 Tax=Methylobacterium sp. SyP6R TaxID=2718876 RepID=UPI001F236242|nr:threonine/serine exporter family protein [Methylobacterium sp. SyP6R]MCF4127500.1 threonine/serine exporter family protein [Methylobacterium sp. SyP6R]